LIAALAYALYGVLQRRWHVDLPSWQSTYLQAIAALSFMLIFEFRLPLRTVLPNRASLPLIVYAGTSASILLPYFWMQGVKHLGANRSSMFMTLLPVATAIIAVGWFREHLHVYHLLGGGIALLGVLLAQMLRRPLLIGASHRPAKLSKREPVNCQLAKGQSQFGHCAASRRGMNTRQIPNRNQTLPR
jgi:drug/metabolite transporter (DMT)-like permease